MLDDNAKSALGQGTMDPLLQPHGPTENSLDHVESPPPTGPHDAPQGVSPIDAAFNACRAVGGGDGAFGNAWTERLIEVVQPSYRLLCLTHDKPAELAKLARLAEIRFTAATEKNPGLLCVKLAARPKNSDQDRLCSEWSTLLSCALAKNIAPDGFIAWVGTTTIRGCKAIIAREKADARAEAGQAPRKRSRAQPDGGRADEVPGATGEGDAMLASIQMAVLEALTAPGSEAERRERVIASLRSFADSLASDKVPETGSEVAAAGEVLADE